MPSIANEVRSKPGRILSLDVVRGITIAFMILVNNNGSEVYAYEQLKHSHWNGWTLTDLVFPSFLFMVGLAIVFSTETRLAKGSTKRELLRHTCQRAVALFCFGLIVNGFPYFPFATLRIYGVLQRIAICYFVVSVIYLLSRRALTFICVVAISLVSYYIVMRWIPVPGFGLPGKDIPLLDPDRNWVAVIDRALLSCRLYEKVRDPEGLLSTLPAIGTASLGVLTGLWLRSQRQAKEKVLGLLGAAIAGIACGEIWNVWFPINKKLWTSSYVLLAAGCTLLLLALCYFLLDIKQWRKGWTTPWLIFGSNAITAYMFSELLAATLQSIHVQRGSTHLSMSSCIYGGFFQHLGSPSFGSLLYSLSFVTVCFLPNLWLYRKRIFLKV